MAGTIQYKSHSNFVTGMVRDIPRHLIPEGAVYDANNIIITASGGLARRGPTFSALSSATTFSPYEVGSQRSANFDNRSYLYTTDIASGVMKFGNLPFGPSQGTLSTYTSSLVVEDTNQPTVYGDSLVFPNSNTTGTTPFAWCGGANFSETSATYTNASVSITTSSGNSLLTLGATATANVYVGGYIHLSNGGTNEYTGRIVRKDSATQVTVDPPPIQGTVASPITYTSIAYYPILPLVGTKSDGQYIVSAGCIGTFVSGGDSRIVLGDVRIVDAATGASSRYPNRIMWSVREAADATTASYNGSVASSGGTVDGLVQATRMGFPTLNFIDVEDIEQVVGLVPVGSGNMLVLGTKNTVMLSGYLLTQTGGTANSSLGRGGITASIRGFSQQVGCISPKSIQRTSVGVFFAATDGMYLTDGSTLVNTMTKKIANMWSDYTAGGGIFKFDSSTFDGTDRFAPSSSSSTGIYGSANINDSHYYISTSNGGLLCDLRNQFGWTRINSGEVLIAGSCTDSDQTTNRVYAIKYGTSSSSSSVDRIIRIDQVVNPDWQDPYGTYLNSDADGTKFQGTIVTRAYAEGDPVQMRRYRHGLFAFKITVNAQTVGLNWYCGFDIKVDTGLDALNGTYVTKSTQMLNSSSSISRLDMQPLTNAVTYTITTRDYTGAINRSLDNFVLYEITNGFNQLRPGRVTSSYNSPYVPGPYVPSGP